MATSRSRIVLVALVAAIGLGEHAGSLGPHQCQERR